MEIKLEERLNGEEGGGPCREGPRQSCHRLIADLLSIKVKEFYEEVCFLLGELPESEEVDRIRGVVSESRLLLGQVPLDLHFLAGLIESKRITED